MIIDWLAAMARQFLQAEDAGPDEHELSVSFDLAVNAELLGLLYAKNAASQHAVITVALDEYELALA